jgi:hypothetical protein
MEIYSGPKMAHGKYENMNVARSIDRDSTVLGLKEGESNGRVDNGELHGLFIPNIILVMK